MVSIAALWLPILLAAVAVFVASSIIHMVLPYHKNDYAKLPDEDSVLEALRATKVGPGGYFFPMPVDMKDMGSPEMKAKYERGPVGKVNVMPNGYPMTAATFVQWFAYLVAVSVVVAYLTGRTLAPGADYLAVFRIAGTTAFLAYAGAAAADPIWRGERWSVTVKNIFDGLVYGVVTAGFFGWLWPA
jgi:hypothetical protein